MSIHLQITPWAALAALWRRLGAAGLMLAAGLALAAGAARAEDPPARAGRIAEISGEAWVFDAERRDWERLTRNQTVGEGDRLRSDNNSRITLRIGSTTLWLDERSELEFERLDDERVLLRVERGTLALRLRAREQAQDYRLVTREGRFYPDGEGLFRVDQLERGSRALAWSGRLRFEFRAAEADPVWLNAGEQAEFWWSQGARTERQPQERDAFARWLKDQREAEGEIQSYRYVSPEMTGAEDLDRYGRWDSHAEYGAIWVPTQVVAGWEPYRYGRWVWSPRWGWTWVDEAPWGFAPFHYGRWVIIGGRWCWAPGRYVQRPVYAPALVSWNVNIQIGGGSRPPPPRPGAWAPLPPHQVYTPIYRHTPGYRERINRDHDPAYQPRPGGERPPRPREDGPGSAPRPGMPGTPGVPVVTPQPQPQRPGQPGPQPGRGSERPSPQPAPQPSPVPAPVPTPANGAGERPNGSFNPLGQSGAAPAPAVVQPAVERGSERPNGSYSAPVPATPQPAPTPQIVQPNRGFERATERGDRGSERVNERGNERINERASERSGERAQERSTDRFGDRPNGSYSAPRAVERPVERQVERQVERPAERAVERQVERPSLPQPVRAPQAPAARAEERAQPQPQAAKEDKAPQRGRGEPGKREQQQ